MKKVALGKELKFGNYEVNILKIALEFWGEKELKF